jgi:isopentenyl diphosphate isomerase/L-lactate dehydrogenase-like FMN-dependent dehydrogenase
MIGRPYLWGLGVGGAAGMATLAKTMKADLRVTMAGCGVTSLSQINRDLICA